MKYIRRNYIKKGITKEWLLFNGFRYNRLFNIIDTEVYTYRFPVYKYESFTILECELKVILGEDNIYINVYGYKTINKYSPFYSDHGEYNIILKEIWIKIEKQLKKMNITKVSNMEEHDGNKN